MALVKTDVPRVVEEGISLTSPQTSQIIKVGACFTEGFEPRDVVIDGHSVPIEVLRPVVKWCMSKGWITKGDIE